jgi:bacillithiol system protein YtxJ
MDLGLTPLRSLADLERELAASHVQPVVLFKHSHTCGISAEALDELRLHLEQRAHDARYAWVTVQTHRDISNAIAVKLGVRHETPQAILVRGGRPVWSASHFRVNVTELDKALRHVGTV